MIENTNDSEALADKQRSHTLLVFCNAATNKTDQFSSWFKTDCQQAIATFSEVLSVRHYKEYPFTIIERYKPIGFEYLSIIQLNLDGAEDVSELIDQINTLCQNEPSAGNHATWLYYPVSEKVGCNRDVPYPSSPIITIAFANPVTGREAEFQEWYGTQHIRHALVIPALISGQLFELTGFQPGGAREPSFQAIAIYEQDDTPENMVASYPSIDPVKAAKVKFSPSGDLTRFTEWAYQALD